MEKDDKKNIEELIRGDDTWYRILLDYPRLESRMANKLADAIEKKTGHIELSLDDCVKLVGCVDRLIEREKELIEVKKRYERATDIIREAYKTYHSPTGRQDARARRALKTLGFTEGKRQSKIDKLALLLEYSRLITFGDADMIDRLIRGDAEAHMIERPKPMEKWAAIEFLAEKHGIASKEACFQHLKLAVIERKKKFEAKGGNGWGKLLPWIADR